MDPTQDTHTAIPDTQRTSSGTKQSQKRVPFVWFTFFAILIGTPLFIWMNALSPSGQTTKITVDIPEGSSVRSIAALLESSNVIRSPEMFAFLVQIKKVDTSLPSGTFQFNMPINVFSVVEQLRKNDRGIVVVKVTIPEGSTNRQIASILTEKLPDIRGDEFLKLVEDKEGYLFPDTYFFYANATSGTVIAALSENFVARTSDLYAESNNTGKKWSDIIVMASIIEEEAVTNEDRLIISGVLWRRLERGMRLQVDAPFMYLIGKASSEITIEDLNSDSPYNTYRNNGLPPGAISNPGILAIDAALHPQKTDYVYYLSDKNGVMHYARTFEEHKLNKAKYLR